MSECPTFVDSEDWDIITNPSDQIYREVESSVLAKIPFTTSDDLNIEIHAQIKSPNETAHVHLIDFDITKFYKDATSRRIDFINNIAVIEKEWGAISENPPSSSEWENQATIGLNYLKSLDSLIGISDLHDEIITILRVAAISESSKSLSEAKQKAMLEVLGQLIEMPSITEQDWDVLVRQLESARFDISYLMTDLSETLNKIEPEE